MCHKTRAIFTVCAHSQKVPTIKCDSAPWWKPMLDKDPCIVTRFAELTRGWCPECEAVFQANAVNRGVAKDFDPRSAEFISRYWAYKSQAGWVGPVKATRFPKDLVERKDEIVCNMLGDTRYEIYALRCEIEVYRADRVCIEKLCCVAPGPAEFPAIIDKARRLTLKWGIPDEMDEPTFPKLSSFPPSKPKVPDMAKQD
ncbi:hypothetical protein NCS52_00366400 [Fusarium sp. LHS14.1]|nr:hypothetical protein NCS52_00366400 [Fusarium sp. LHS14.1]